MKKIISFLVCISILLFTIGCSNADTTKNQYVKSLENLHKIPKQIVAQYKKTGSYSSINQLLEATTATNFNNQKSIKFSGIIFSNSKDPKKNVWPNLAASMYPKIFTQVFEKIENVNTAGQSIFNVDSSHIALTYKENETISFIILDTKQVLNIADKSTSIKISYLGKEFNGSIPKSESRLMLYLLIASSVIVSIIISQITSWRTKKISNQALTIVEDSEERYRTLISEVNDITLVSSGDGIINFISPSVQKILGYPPEYYIGKPTIEFINTNNNSVSFDTLKQIRSNTAQISPFEIVATSINNEKKYFEVIGTNLLENKAISGIVFNCRDITFQKSSEASIAASRALFEQALTKAPIGIALIDKNYKCFWHNISLLTFLNVSSDQLSKHSLTEWISDEHKHLFDKELQQLSGKAIEIMFENGLWASITLSFVPENKNSEKYYIIQISDVTDKHLMQEKLTHQAIHDSLTGLPNKLLFYDRLKHALLRNKRFQEGTAVLFCDIDHFKEINDGMGHVVGDELLLIISDRIKNAVRANDTVARFGGDEFVILCENSNYEEEIIEIANRIINEVKKPLKLNGEEVFVTTSVGIYNVKDINTTADEVLKYADSAMYVAKNSGRDQVAIYDDTQESSILANLKIGNDLHRALINNEFELLFQPIISLTNGDISGFESLIYWNHPDKGLVKPSSFIMLAEETDLIIPIGDWVLEESIKNISNWNSKFSTNLSISVNISYRQLVNPQTTETIKNLLQRYNLEPSKLHLEITESSFVKDSSQVREMIKDLREFGCVFAIDDFGTGYSSLVYLKRFSAEVIKIDTSFTKNIGITDEDSAIVAAITNLGMALNMDVVAEGIETQEQLSYLLTLGCQYGQGYLFSRPVNINNIDILLQNKLFNWSILESK